MTKKAQKGSKRKAIRRRLVRKQPRKGHLKQLASYHIDGKKLATLEEVLDPTVPTMNLPEITEQKRIDLVLARLRKEPKGFRIAMIGPGVIDKARAIAEVEAGSRIGRLIMEIEQNLLLHLTKAR